MRYTDCGTLDANANQKFSWGLQFSTSAGGAYDLTGCVMTCQIRATAQPATALVTPTITVTTPTTGAATFSYTQAQSAALIAPGITPAQTAKFHVEVDLAYADDSTHPSERFVWVLAVSPGGNG